MSDTNKQAFGSIDATDPRNRLKERLEETRLAASVKEAMLVDLPSQGEQQRRYEELQQRGGYSIEHLLESTDAEGEPL